MHLLITIGTDGPTNWVKTPDGQRFNLGPTPALGFVTKLALGSHAARKALDGFLRGEEVMLKVDESRMWDLLAPRRTRWAADSFIPRDQRTRGTQDMYTIAKDLGVLARHIEALDKAAGQNTSPEKMAEGVGILVKLADETLGRSRTATYLMAADGESDADEAADAAEQEAEEADAPKTAADDKVDAGRLGAMVDRVEKQLKEMNHSLGLYKKDPARYKPQLDNLASAAGSTMTAAKVILRTLGKKVATVSPKLSYDVYKTNAKLAEQILDQMIEVHDKIDEIVTAGKKGFKATAAKADIHAVTAKVAGITADVDLTVPWVHDDLQRLASRAAHLHGLFFPKD